MNPDLKEIEAVFFAAMIAGYAAEANKSVVSTFPRLKLIPYTKGNYTVHDGYYTKNTSNASFGSTIIWHRGEPVWSISYQGRYDERAIPFLKRALMVNYASHIFNGGRGPAEFIYAGWIYRNVVLEDHGFRHFRGREEISRVGECSYGWHEYQGMSHD